MKRLIKSICLLSSAITMCIFLTSCTGNRLTAVTAGGTAEIVFYKAGGGSVTVTGSAEIKSYVKEFRAVKVTKHKDKFESWQWKHTIAPAADLCLTVDLVYTEEKDTIISAESNTKDSFKIYEDATVFKNGMNCLYKGDISRELIDKILLLFT